jgi:hypothetical protein
MRWHELSLVKNHFRKGKNGRKTAGIRLDKICRAVVSYGGVNDLNRY